MAKTPDFNFCAKDWLGDTRLRMASPSTRGIWIDLLCFMWDLNPKGEISASSEDICKMTGASLEEFKRFSDEAQKYNFCDFSVTDNGLSQIRNRRMYRNDIKRKNSKLRQRRHRAKGGKNGGVTLKSQRGSQCPHQNIIELYHEKLPEAPIVTTWPESLQKFTRARWQTKGQDSIEFWEKYFDYVSHSKWLTGQVKDWCADLEWLVRPTNFNKVLNGRYHRNMARIYNNMEGWIDAQQN